MAMAALCAVLAAMVVMRSRAARPGAAPAPAAAPGAARAALVPSGAPLVPDFTVLDFDGRTLRSVDFRGKVTILNFWATWCPPCRIEIPEFVALQKKYPDRLQIVGLSMDDTAAGGVKRFVDARKINYRVAMATPEIAARFGGVPALPTSFLIDAAGRVVARHIGLYDAGAWDREIRALAGLPYDGQVDFSDAGPALLGQITDQTEIPGVDLSGLTPAERHAALQRMNSEPCTCGCGLTIAQCRISDTTCDVSLPLAQKIVDEVKRSGA
jgi:thiol-disulfide isomerase/thioredoxin